jgi:1-acyl-sn-glycerol-3-phosphate acyltransferase
VALLALIALLLAPILSLVELTTLLGRPFGRRPRWRVARVAVFAAVYTVGECLCLSVCLALWLRSPIPRWRDPARWQAAHVWVLRTMLGVLLRAAKTLFGFRLRLDSPRGHTLDPDRPLVVLGRHAGPGASFVLVHVLLDFARVPRIVLKSRLRLDPALDVVLTRIGCAFVGASGSSRAVEDLAARLRPGDALVIFPEGSDWTPTRHRLAVQRLRMRGLRRRAEAAAARPNVLPPRPAGTLAALTGAPDAQLAVFMHTGHDELLDAAALWRALPLQQELHMVWWSQPRPQLADEAACGGWLEGLWGDIDTWIRAERRTADLET